MKANPSNDIIGCSSLKTIFERVRVIIVRLKNKSFEELIDCSDFTFSKTGGNGIMHLDNVN